jgi:hypothetical protein
MRRIQRQPQIRAVKEQPMLNSNYATLCPVSLPYKGRQKYMHSFDLSKPIMAEGFKDYLEPVLALCNAAGATHGMAHMTVDEKIVSPGMSQRRPRPHVDGCFIPARMDWSHQPGPAWAHYCNNIAGGTPYRRMPIIVAASVAGCRVWRGEFDAEPKADGDLSHISDRLGDGEIVPPNIGYLLSRDCVHESMIFERGATRTFLRIALPVEFEHPSFSA